MPRSPRTKEQETGLSISSAWLERLSKFAAETMGLWFPPERWRDLEKAVNSVAEEFGFDDPKACAQWLVSLSLEELQDQYVETLASHLTVGETYFFRDMAAFDGIERQIIPQLIERRKGNNRHLKIWSAGCCTGEEPYSIAILLSRVLPDHQEWRISLTGTDINTRFLQKASEGTYGKWSFRSTPDWVRKGYFRQKRGGRYEILPHIRKMVQFEYLNLAKDTFPSLAKSLFGVDVIFCRNVLMYFTPERARAVLAGFYRTLVDGGWLVVAPVDLLHVKDPECTLFSCETPSLYRKRDGSLLPGTVWEHPDLSGYGPHTGYSEHGKDQVPALERLEEIPVPRSPTETYDVNVSVEGAAASEKRGHQDKPSKKHSRYEEALALYEAGHYEEAIRRLNEPPFSDQPEPPRKEWNADEMTLLARTYANLGDYVEAVTWCDRSIAANKLKPFSYYLRAGILQEDGRIEEAVTSIRQALYLDPDYAMAHFVMGNLALLRGKREKSSRHFAHASRLAKAHPEDAVLPQSEDITAGRLMRIIDSITERGF